MQLLSLVVPIVVFILASNLLYKMNCKTDMRNAIQITTSERGEYLASKFGVKVKFAFFVWIFLLCILCAINLALQFVPHLYELDNYASVVRAFSGIMLTLQFVAAYEYISSAETLAQVCSTDSSNQGDPKIDWISTGFDSDEVESMVNDPSDEEFSSYWLRV